MDVSEEEIDELSEIEDAENDDESSGEDKDQTEDNPRVMQAVSGIY